MTLDAVVLALGHQKFLEKEAIVIEKALQSDTPAVIAPGGSIAYHTSLIEIIQKNTHSIYIDVPLDTLQKRIGTTPRGIVNAHGSFADLYAERIPLNQKFSSIVVDGTHVPEQIVLNIVNCI